MRSYQEIKAHIVTRLSIVNSKLGYLPDGDPMVKFVSLFSGVVEYLQLYIEKIKNEAFIFKATEYSSLSSIARQFDYKIKLSQPAMADITVTYKGSTPFTGVVIPINTKFSTAKGVNFYSIKEGVIPSGSNSVVIQAEQRGRTYYQPLGLSTGEPNQMLTLPIDTLRVLVTVDGEVYVVVEDSIYAYLPTDKVCFLTVNEDKLPVVVFGDGINGVIPPVGSSINAEITTTSGSAGNLTNNTITTGDLPQVSGFTPTVTNLFQTSGGAGIESFTSLLNSIPASVRTSRAIVTPSQWVIGLLAHKSITHAGVIFRCGFGVEAYVLTYGGYPTSFHLEEITQYLRTKVIMGTQYLVKRAGIATLQIEADLFLKNNAKRNEAVTEAYNGITAYLGNRKDLGGYIPQSDIIAVLDNLKQVDYVVFKKCTILPYFFAEGTSPEADYSIEVLPTSFNCTYRAQFITPSQYQLFRITDDNEYLGVFTVNNLYTDTCVSFTISNTLVTYAANDEYTFRVYPYNTTDLFSIDTPLAVIANTSSILFKVEGGLL